MISKNLICLLATIFLATASFAEAQQAGKVSRIGYLTERPPGPDPRFESLGEGLRDLGYVERKNIVIERRSSEGNRLRLGELPTELVRPKVDVIVTTGMPTSLAVKKTTMSIPIVFAGVGADPIATGLVASLARPGSNITGFTVLGPELNGKRVELLKETFPRLSRLAVFWNPTTPGKLVDFEQAEAAAKALGLQLQSLEVRDSHDFDEAFAALPGRRADGFLMIPDPLINNHTTRIVDFAAKTRLPTMFDLIEQATGLGLMAYGADRLDTFRRAPTYVDKILKGAKPADLPIQQSTKYELVINLKTAKQIGLTIPPTVLARADKVIR